MSVNGNITKLVEVQKELSPEMAEYIGKYLSNAPYWVLDSAQIVSKKKDTMFIEENTPVDFVYILLKGTVRAVDYRIKGVAYDYMWFQPGKTFGAMEVFYKIPLYMTTIMTVTDCTMLVMSKKNYERWIWDDKNALQMEIISTGNMLLDQNRTGRIFLFLQGMDRIIYFFVRNYNQQKQDNMAIFDISRQEIAERSGFSVKTVNRAVKKMEEEGYITKKGHKIIISEEQYLKMKGYLAPIVEEY